MLPPPGAAAATAGDTPADAVAVAAVDAHAHTALVVDRADNALHTRVRSTARSAPLVRAQLVPLPVALHTLLPSTAPSSATSNAANANDASNASNASAHGSAVFLLVPVQHTPLPSPYAAAAAAAVAATCTATASSRDSAHKHRRPAPCQQCVPQPTQLPLQLSLPPARFHAVQLQVLHNLHLAHAADVVVCQALRGNRLGKAHFSYGSLFSFSLSFFSFF